MKFGDVSINWLGHAGFLIASEIHKKFIYIDPYQLPDYESSEKADIILITHSHYDHCSIEDIEKIVKPGTVIVVSPDAQSKIGKLNMVGGNIEMQIMTPGDEIEVKNVRIEAVPAYNLQKQYHPKSEGWNGYLIKFNGVVVYHAGDTDVIPEMKKLSGYGGQPEKTFVALLPVGGTYTMTAEQAVRAARLIKPDFAIPMHYASIVGSREDAERFVSLCEKEGIKAEVIDRGF